LLILLLIKYVKVKLRFNRKFPFGAEIILNEGTNFRVWAPGKKTVDLVIFSGKDRSAEKYRLNGSSEDGYFEVTMPSLAAGTLYKFALNGVDDYYPDPASRFQPFGPHGPSEVVDYNSFKWTDQQWKGIDNNDLIIYEMHIGTFTKEGTWKSAEEKLQYLSDTGINLLEIMPVAEFPGEFGWGYDGVSLFAPTRLYGRPDDFKSFINTAHNLGIGVILDVVYNHLGPDGNYLGKFSDSYTTDKYETDWGAAINYDGKGSRGVREFYKSNARFWIDEYNLDGLRLDATQDIFDDSEVHILAEIHDDIRRTAKRSTYIVTENEPQNCILVQDRDKGGIGFDGMWNDDFHHTAMVALTGKREAYYTDYYGSAQEFVSAIKHGFLYQGQFYKWQKKRRGRPSFDLDPTKLVHFIQNHDQIANSGRGLRIDKLSSPGLLRAITAVMMLGPQTPMLFQGQEFGSSAPFYYFADHKKELAEQVRDGRREFLSQFRSIASKKMQAVLIDPGSKDAFLKCQLDHSEVEKNKGIYDLHKDLIHLRRTDPVLKLRNVDGAVLSESCFIIRFFEGEEDRLLIVNLGIDLDLSPAPEPLLAPVEGRNWEILWSSEDPSYGGGATPSLEIKYGWIIPGYCAVLLKPEKFKDNNEKDSKKNFLG
jgi:maltooligosyltrehalose trehalohydrolase